MALLCANCGSDQIKLPGMVFGCHDGLFTSGSTTCIIAVCAKDV